MKPKRTAQPRHRGPIGRKMWLHADCMVSPNPPTEAVARLYENPIEPVLVLSLDPANVERMADEIAKYIVLHKGYSAPFYVNAHNDALLMLKAIGLTPAKRRGKK